MGAVGHVVGASFLRDAGFWILVDVDGVAVAVETSFRRGMDEGLYVDVEQSRLFMLGTVEEKLLVLVDTDALSTGEEPDFEPSCCKDCDAE